MASPPALLFPPVLTVLAACAAAPEDARVPVPHTAPPLAPRPESTASAPPGKPAPTPLQAALDDLTAGREAEGLAGLREELASGEEHVQAALALASYLAPRERLREALAAVEAGLLRSPEQPLLSMARAGLLRDLGQREDAVQALRRLVVQGGSDPALWREIAELEWLLNRREAALEALESLHTRFSDHPWVQEQRVAIASLEEEIENHDLPQTISQRDLLGNLRGAPGGMQRFHALRALAEEGGELRKRATTIALTDPDPALRVHALRLGTWTPGQTERLGRVALVDPAPPVRAAALPLCQRIDPRIAAPMVFEALARETDPDTFRLMHEALQQIRAVRVFLPPGAAESADGRAAVVSEWKEILWRP